MVNITHKIIEDNGVRALFLYLEYEDGDKYTRRFY